MTDIERMGGIISEMTTDITAMTKITSGMGKAGEDVNRILEELSAYTKKTTDAVDVMVRSYFLCR